MNIMLRTISALLFAANFVAIKSSPELWGSRIITTKSGSVTLQLKHKPGFQPEFQVNRNTGNPYMVTINNGKCWKESEEWSSSCSLDANAETAVITVKDVTAQNDINFKTTDSANQAAYITIVFAPDCKFLPPLEGGVIPKESSPLSRFVKGQSSVPLTFAVNGLTSDVDLYLNRAFKCRYKGRQLIYGNDCALNNGVQTNLEVDTANNMRIFKKEFPLPTTPDGIDFYEWRAANYFVTVTVDKNEAGQSPEMEGCADVTTASTTDIITTTTKTTSSATGTVTSIATANLVLMIALTYFGR